MCSPFLLACRAELESQLGKVEDAALLHLSQQQQALQRWQQQLGPSGAGRQQEQQQAAGKGKAPPPGFVGKLSTAGPEPSALPAMSAEDAVLAVCGVDADVVAAAYATASGDAEAGAAARAAFAAALAPKTSAPRVATAAESAAVEAEVFGAKGRVLNAEAGARWLVQWCARVTGGASDDTVATAVCRMLLSGAACRVLGAHRGMAAGSLQPRQPGAACLAG